MSFATRRIGLPSLRTSLVIDAAFEFAVGAILVLAAGTMGDWLEYGWVASIVSGAIFLVAGVAIVQIVRAPNPDPAVVRALAITNIAGGMVGWVILIVGWSWFGPEGHWTLGIASDLVILLGLLELRGLHA